MKREYLRIAKDVLPLTVVMSEAGKCKSARRFTRWLVSVLASNRLSNTMHACSNQQQAHLIQSDLHKLSFICWWILGNLTLHGILSFAHHSSRSIEIIKTLPLACGVSIASLLCFLVEDISVAKGFESIAISFVELALEFLRKQQPYTLKDLQ